MRLIVGGGRAAESSDSKGSVIVGVRTLSEGGRVGNFSREQVSLFTNWFSNVNVWIMLIFHRHGVDAPYRLFRIKSVLYVILIYLDPPLPLLVILGILKLVFLFLFCNLQFPFFSFELFLQTTCIVNKLGEQEKPWLESLILSFLYLFHRTDYEIENMII